MTAPAQIPQDYGPLALLSPGTRELCWALVLAGINREEFDGAWRVLELMRRAGWIPEDVQAGQLWLEWRMRGLPEIGVRLGGLVAAVESSGSGLELPAALHAWVLLEAGLTYQALILALRNMEQHRTSTAQGLTADLLERASALLGDDVAAVARGLTGLSSLAAPNELAPRL